MILRDPSDEDSAAGRISDDREPRRYYNRGKFDRPRPLGEGITASAPAHRHLFDALVVYGAERVQECREHPDVDAEHRYPEPDRYREFRMNLTCVVCGQIIALEGDLTAPDRYARVDPEPLRAKGLSAQHTATWGISQDWASWAVYGDDGHVVGALATGQTPRGRRYVDGYVQDAGGRRVQVQAPTPIGALRKLAALYPVVSA